MLRRINIGNLRVVVSLTKVKGWSRVRLKFLSTMSAQSTPGMNKLRLIDIGANLTDEMYSGIYNGNRKHEPDLDKVLSRAWNKGVEKVFVTAGNLDDLKASLKLVQTNDKLFTTVGVHPTRCSEFDQKLGSSKDYLDALKKEFDDNKDKIIALGEFGLDYERLKFCDEETQRKYFRLQLQELGSYVNRPLFLHCRAAASDLMEILNEHKPCYSRGGVVHSFDGSLDEMKGFLELGLHIGINGCSLKADDNLKAVKEIPVNRLLLETDAPWCGIRPSHASFKYVQTKFPESKKSYDEKMMYKSRNEPQTILNVLEVVAGIKDMDITELANQVYENTERLFCS